MPGYDSLQNGGGCGSGRFGVDGGSVATRLMVAATRTDRGEAGRGSERVDYRRLSGPVFQDGDNEVEKRESSQVGTRWIRGGNCSWMGWGIARRLVRV